MHPLAGKDNENNINNLLIASQVLPLGAADNLFPLEVHIRTGEMHRLAQYGIACERWVRAGL